MDSIYMTRGINNEVADNEIFAKEITSYLARYIKRDWGDLCESDKKMNTEALEHGGRLLAAYKSSKGKVYIITDDTKAADKVTTILFANEY